MNGSRHLGSQRIRLVMGAAVLCIGLLVLIGWVGDIDSIKQILPDLATMKVNTAIGFILSGAALVMFQMGVFKDRGARPVILVGQLSTDNASTGLRVRRGDTYQIVSVPLPLACKQRDELAGTWEIRAIGADRLSTARCACAFLNRCRRRVAWA